MDASQRHLSEEQIKSFYIDNFVDGQVSHFTSLTQTLPVSPTRKVVDMGGGCGYFARQLHEVTGLPVRVVDMDERSIEKCRELHDNVVEAVQGDALAPVVEGDEGVVCFNLILHHLVADTEARTRDLQKQALNAWKRQAQYVFVNEYTYNSFAGGITGRLIYEITKSKTLSALAGAVSKFVPSLRANTLGVGVRFRSFDEWKELFREGGWEVIETALGVDYGVPIARRLLLLQSCRRDSFLLRRTA